MANSPVLSKVAMFNKKAAQAKQLQPLASNDGHTFSKDEYGIVIPGTLTDMRAKKAKMEVMSEILELCEIINSEGYKLNDEAEMRVQLFKDLFNIYNNISDKVVGLLLRARKHNYVNFKGEILFQHRDDDVPIFLTRPIQEIRQEILTKIESIKNSICPEPTITTMLLN